MEAKYKVAITKDYKRFLFIILTPLFILMSLMMTLGFLLEYKVILPRQLTYEVVMPVCVVLFLVIGYFISLIKYYKEEVVVGTDYIESPSLGVVSFIQIESYKSWTYRGYTTFFIKNKAGKKIAIGPTSNFSISADKVFAEFIKDFEKRITAYKKTNLS